MVIKREKSRGEGPYKKDSLILEYDRAIKKKKILDRNKKFRFSRIHGING